MGKQCKQAVAQKNAPMDPQLLKFFTGLVQPRRLARIDQILQQRLQSVCLVLDDLHDPQNIAATLRSAEALGVQDVHIIEHGPRFRLKRKPARSSEAWVTVQWHQRAARCLGDLQARGFEVWGADVGPGCVPLGEVPIDRPVAVVMGSERQGLGTMTRRYLDGRFSIPMFGFVESFNVSVATALSLSEFARRRRDFLQAAGDLHPQRRQALRAQWIQFSVRRWDVLRRAFEQQQNKL